LTTIEQMLTLPCAHGGPAGRARVRATPEDFIVREWLGFAADGDGEHLLLKVRKRGANTLWVAKQLARLGRIDSRDVGFAGLKDRDAVAEQSFTVPVRSAIGVEWAGVEGEGFTVLAAERHRRKLKRGALRGNDFEIVLRDFAGDVTLLEERLRVVAAAGMPNYFGPQRFGREGHNIDVALAWFSSGAQPHDRAQRSFALSAARAAIFNAILAQRIAEGTWNELQPGDLANLNGSGSIFAVDEIDATLRDRCRQLDIHPTGPLWGKTLASSGAVTALEQTVADRFPILAAGLSRAGVESERRALRTPLGGLQWMIDAQAVKLSFRLQRGSFATAVLHELIDNAFATDAPEMDD
jgi:tRNA pseudouridine13 synthase